MMSPRLLLQEQRFLWNCHSQHGCKTRVFEYVQALGSPDEATFCVWLALLWPSIRITFTMLPSANSTALPSSHDQCVWLSQPNAAMLAIAALLHGATLFEAFHTEGSGDASKSYIFGGSQVSPKAFGAKGQPTDGGNMHPNTKQGSLKIMREMPRKYKSEIGPNQRSKSMRKHITEIYTSTTSI